MAQTTPAVYHYLDIGRLGRGEVVKLFLKDAGIDFTEVRYPFDDTWPQTSQKLQEEGITRTGQVPALEYQGHILTQHIPILRYLARDLGRYDGETNWERYLVDAVADIYIDWRAEWVCNLMKKSDKYKNELAPKYFNLIEKYYSDSEGPYLLGDKITYVDFAVYQIIDNDRRTGTAVETLPGSLVRLQEAVEKRDNIAAYIEENK
ncbi:glutathione S-transferase [Aspergillus ibericus CBS 121593]|uniref:Glutathione S-transferase n=1 Tax=Aspergillus ibericus CBS 121593 TaxID=1448316 RepID=A0A395H8L8_9EURO|nr:glutathione S-transferase [Aspergillus ibericus CBS 121593]RAL03505.1 glutathione S-transferase [Aspergillus ibericus CBS 121593]